MADLSKAMAVLAPLFVTLVPYGAASAAAPACGPQTFTVYFDEWKSGLNPESRAALAAAQRSFAGCEITHVRIVGLAGAKGGAHDNQTLSEQRARTIAMALTAGGWPAERLETVALGDSGAKAGDLDRPIRRRVHVEVQARPQPAHPLRPARG